MIHTIDAKDKTIGKVSTEAAQFLIGKNITGFKRNVIPSVTVKIINASHVRISEKKRDNKVYKRYSGYFGGLKEETLKSLAGRRGYGEVFRHAVKGMLPKNKLQSKMLKNLVITE